MKKQLVEDANIKPSSKRIKRKRNKAAQLLLLPVIFIMWIIGWIFYWLG